MRVLVLGGTWFLGRAVVEDALGRGWSVTTFNRGRSQRDVPGVVAIHGDRTVETDLARLAAAGPWDVVVDTSGQEPWIVSAAVRALAEVAARYVFLSTVTVYPDWPDQPVDETSPVRPASASMRADDPEAGVGRDAYGTLKAGAELAVRQVFGDKRSLILRPSVILGQGEYVGRLPWMLRRMAAGGEVLAAGDPERGIQVIDARDVAAFALAAASDGLAGAFNLAAPEGAATYGELWRACADVTHAADRSQLVWVSDEWLSRQDVKPWTEIPLWRTQPGTWRVDVGKAVAAGLTCRPLSETVADTWEWLRREDPVASERQAEHGLDRHKETALLAAWRRRTDVGHSEIVRPGPAGREVPTQP